MPTAPGSPLAAPVRLRGLIEWAPCECQFGCPIAVVNRLGTGGQRQKSARLAWEFGASPSGNSPRVPKSRAPAVAVRPGLLMSRWGAGGNATLVRIHRQPKSHRQIKSWLSSERTLVERDKGNLREWCPYCIEHSLDQQLSRSPTGPSWDTRKMARGKRTKRTYRGNRNRQNHISSVRLLNSSNLNLVLDGAYARLLEAHLPGKPKCCL